MEKSMAGKPFLHKEDTDWVRDNMLFNYCLGDDDTLLIESFIKNNDIEIHFDVHHYYFCITGVNKKYNFVNTKESFHKSLSEFHDLMREMQEHIGWMQYRANVFLLKIDNSKQIGIIFSPGKEPLCSPEQLAAYFEHAFEQKFPFWKGQFVTSLTGAYQGYEELNRAFLRARELNELEFFDIQGQVITESLIRQKNKAISISKLMLSLRNLRYSMCTSSAQQCLKQVQYIFRQVLTPSFSMMYVITAYAYLEDVFSMFEEAYPGIVQVQHHDTSTMERLRDMEFYVKDTVVRILEQLKGTTRYSPRLMLAVSLIRHNPADDLSLQALADQIGMSQASLSSQFRYETGMTLPEFVARSRISTACRLLRETSLSVNEIAQATGFTTIQYFRKTFRKYMGVTATQYRGTGE